jgi:hypothetical protein
LVLFSTETGDAWLLDALDHLAARLARLRNGPQCAPPMKVFRERCPVIDRRSR